MTSGTETIWELLRQATQRLPEPFSRAALVSWVSQRRPDAELSSISTHIQYAIAQAPNRSGHPLGARTPLLDRIDRGLYRRYRGNGGTGTGPTARRGVSGGPATRADIVLVGCSSSKASGASRAADLFTGAGFRKARDYAERSGRPWYVLSAKFGLLDADEVVAPYDVYLADQSARYRTAWGSWVVAQLAERHDLSGAVVEVRAGEAYCTPLQAPLAAAGAELRTPLAGLRQGEWLAW